MKTQARPEFRKTRRATADAWHETLKSAPLNKPMKKALLLIDLQNDYFPGGLFPLWNTDATLANIRVPLLLRKQTAWKSS